MKDEKIKARDIPVGHKIRTPIWRIYQVVAEVDLEPAGEMIPPHSILIRYEGRDEWECLGAEWDVKLRIGG